MIIHGDVFDVLPTLEADSIDSSVTDPPYGIGFMSKKWDTFSPDKARASKMFAMGHGSNVGAELAKSDNPNLRGRRQSPAMSPSQIEYDYSIRGMREFQKFSERWGREVYRVLKPGAYLAASCAPRSYHRMACGLEDSGFIVRDMFSWLFGQGYPKSVDVARVVDMKLCGQPGRHCMRKLPPEGKRQPNDHVCAESELGRQWEGWGSGLKPGHEPIILCRKPLAGTLAESVMEWYVGALNIGACRLDSAPSDDYRQKLERFAAERRGDSNDFGMPPGPRGGSDLGRWPANVLIDDEVAMLLQEDIGDVASGPNPSRRSSAKFQDIYGEFEGQEDCTPARGIDAGGVSRYFYVAKPSREERDAGCQGLQAQSGGKATGRKDGSAGVNNPRAGANRTGGARNIHPTVKPLALMRWLVRLLTPVGGTVLDPFAGSGTTGMACRYELMEFVGVEREAEYVAIAEARIKNAAPLLAEMIGPDPVVEVPEPQLFDAVLEGGE